MSIIDTARTILDPAPIDATPAPVPSPIELFGGRPEVVHPVARRSQGPSPRSGATQAPATTAAAPKAPSAPAADPEAPAASRPPRKAASAAPKPPQGSPTRPNRTAKPAKSAKPSGPVLASVDTTGMTWQRAEDVRKALVLGSNRPTAGTLFTAADRSEHALGDKRLALLRTPIVNGQFAEVVRLVAAVRESQRMYRGAQRQQLTKRA